MKSVHRVGDKNTGHDDCQAVTLIEGSSNVFVNSQSASRLGDKYSSHNCKQHAPHSGNLISGSSTVFVNKRPLCRVGDDVSCGGSAAEGSDNVFAG